MVASIRSTLRLPYVALQTDAGPLAADGIPGEHLVTLPLTYGGDRTGRVVIGLRPGERRLSDADRRVLELLAAPLAVAVHATVVSANCRPLGSGWSRPARKSAADCAASCTTASVPTLTGIAFTADAAANLLSEPARAEPLLTSLRRETRVALADVRRVVEDLRPPALDELGLVGALRQRAEQLRWRADGARLTTVVDVPDDLPALPAAVEVAAYRIATEALTNIARHSDAGAGHRVRLEVGRGWWSRSPTTGTEASRGPPGSDCRPCGSAPSSWAVPSPPRPPRPAGGSGRDPVGAGTSAVAGVPVGVS